jgi:hypothetical protein
MHKYSLIMVIVAADNITINQKTNDVGNLPTYIHDIMI